MEKQAVFLDLDGTLADSLHVMKSVYRSFLESHGARPSEKEFQEMNGPPLPVVVEILKNRHNLPGNSDQLLAAYLHRVDAVYESVEPSAGAPQFMQRVHAAGWTTGIVTSNSAERTRRWLNRVGLAEYFDVIVAGEDISEGKPSPQPYLTALKKAACGAGNACAVEDSIAGCRSAVTAGLKTFGYCPDGEIIDTAWTGVAKVVRSFDELSALLLLC